MRHALVLLLGFAACGGGGGGSSAILPPPDPPPTENPAPAPPRGEPADLTGIWRLVESTVIEGAGEPSPLGTLLEIVPAGSGYVAQTVLIPVHGGNNVLAPVARQDIEGSIGFPLDWYENEGDGTFFDFGYGWDRLRVPGGGGATHDFLQYGLRLAPESDRVLVGFEAECIESFLGNPRVEWVAAVRLLRTP